MVRPDVLEEEFLHDAVDLAGQPPLLRCFVAAQPIEAGTVIVRAQGYPSEAEMATVDTSELLRVVLGLGKDHPLFAKLATLCPLHPSENLQHLAKFENDRAELEKLQQQFEPATHFSVDEMIHILLKIDHNALAPGLFPLASFHNHSCKANCVGMRTDDEDMFEVRTIANVAPGEPLTLNYLDESLWYTPSSVRQEHLNQRYHFECECERCSGKLEAEHHLCALACPNKATNGCLGDCVKTTTDGNVVECALCGAKRTVTDGDSVISEAQRSLPENQGMSAQARLEQLEATLAKLELVVSRNHWVRVALLRRLSETAFAAAIELREYEDGDTAQRSRFLQACRTHVQAAVDILECLSSVYTASDYHLSTWHDTIATTLARLEDEGEAVGKTWGTAESHRQCAVQIRDVCGWMLFDF